MKGDMLSHPSIPIKSIRRETRSGKRCNDQMIEVDNQFIL